MMVVWQDNILLSISIAKISDGFCSWGSLAFGRLLRITLEKVCLNNALQDEGLCIKKYRLEQKTMEYTEWNKHWEINTIK